MTEPLKAAYGTWKSPITADAITKGANSIEDVIVDGKTLKVYHIERRPSEKGRSVLVETKTGRDVVGEGWNVRTGVQEYGGSAALVHDGVAYFSHYADGRVYRVSQGKEPEPITPDGKPYRYANFEFHPHVPHLLVAVLEDHTVDEPSSIVTSLCTIDIRDKTVHPLLSGADFYALPKFSPNGARLAWQEWYHPDMPWQGGELYVANISVDDATGLPSLEGRTHVAGARGQVSAGYPAWVDNGTLIFVSDESGYVNPWKFENGKASPLFPQPVCEDFASPFWSLGQFPYAIVGSGIALFTAIKDGRDVLYSVNIAGGSPPERIESPYVSIHGLRSLSRESEEFVFGGQKTDEKESIVQCTLSSLAGGKIDIIKASSGSTFPPELVSNPRPIQLTVPGDNSPLHVVYYPPHNPKYSGSSVEGELPPCVLNVHGGPTGHLGQALDWKKQYFTSRGWGWLDVNYGGSSGYGRTYIERLNGRWGEVDVEDCVLAAKALSASPYNLIDSKRIMIRGGSAGGFTVLAAISIASDLKVFAAAQSSYGISDLQKLEEFTHKFESQYLNRLIGGTPAEKPEVYKARSPIYHADNIVTPLLILQGEIDKVVPKEQAEVIYQSIKDRGGIVEYKLYAGEGHGWRQEQNMKDALERELGFYERTLGLKG